ncbi:MAG TPA: serine/threonine-protein kinase [Ktedonobacterales bacterium]|nr:serine/threonine-protein kinase [Ktedonobacterales bacterium]
MDGQETGSLIGQSLGDCLLRGLLGIGGMAEVYRAMDLALEREVAVKVLPPALAADADFVRRFRKEAQQVAAMQHPHIVPIYAFGEERGVLYHVMPLLAGSLRDRLNSDGRLTPNEAIRLTREIASALEAAHELGLLHRDVKPENILLDADGNALLTDFGIARELSALREPGAARTIARTGLPVGTPEYMAPEQLRGDLLDQRVDVYALGVVLYELLTGKPPFEATTPYEIGAQVLMAPLEPPSRHNPAIWPALEHTILKALARDPASRYPDMHSFAAALDLAQHRTDALWTSQTLPPITPPVTARARFSAPRLPLPTTAAAAALLLLAVTGATALALHGLAPASGPGGTQAASVDGAASLAATATSTPTARPKPTATHSPKPSIALRYAPAPLVLERNDKVCRATQIITNNTGQTIGWIWQNPPSHAGLFYTLNGRMASWPGDLSPGIRPGEHDTLTVTAPCKDSPVSFKIVANDTLGTRYTFMLTVP